MSSDGKSEGRKDRKSTRLNSSHSQISYAVFCLKKKKNASYGPRRWRCGWHRKQTSASAPETLLKCPPIRLPHQLRRGLEVLVKPQRILARLRHHPQRPRPALTTKCKGRTGRGDSATIPC